MLQNVLKGVKQTIENIQYLSLATSNPFRNNQDHLLKEVIKIASVFVYLFLHVLFILSCLHLMLIFIR